MNIPLFRDDHAQRLRYIRTPHNEVIMDIKDKIVDICRILNEFQANTRLSMFLNEFCIFE